MPARSALLEPCKPMAARFRKRAGYEVQSQSSEPLKHSLVGCLRRSDGGDIAHPKPNAQSARTQSLLREVDHPGVEGKRIHDGSAKGVEN